MDLLGMAPSAQRVITAAIVARLPLAMLDIALLVHTREQTGSFAKAGTVSGAYAIALCVGDALLGRLIDRYGGRPVLFVSATVASTLLVTIAALSARGHLAIVVGLAAASGLAAPPVATYLRTQLPGLVRTPEALSRSYAVETSLVELTYIFGPPLALAIGSLWSSGAALVIAGLALLVATVALVAPPASRRHNEAAATLSPPTNALGNPALRTIVVVLFLVGLLLGADEVAVLAAVRAAQSSASAIPLFAVWGVGSFVGGLLMTRVERPVVGITALLAALTVGNVALVPVTGNLLGLGLVLFVAGAAIAPTEGHLYALVGTAGSSHVSITAAFAWLAAAMDAGYAVGAEGGGLVADHASATAVFAVASAAGLLAVLTSVFTSRGMAVEAVQSCAEAEGGTSPESLWDCPTT
jgi:predicted MFS family arabinose efflux permease